MTGPVLADVKAMEYMVTFQGSNHEAGKGEMLRGWYHSCVSNLSIGRALTPVTLAMDAGCPA